MTRCGDGLATGADLDRAARAAVEAALASLRGAVPDLVAVFVTGAEADQAASALLAGHDAAGAPSTLGCSAVGVVGADRAVSDEPAVSAWACSMPEARLRSFHLEVMRTKDAWAVVGMPVHRDEDTVGLLLTDPWSFPGEGFVGASRTALGPLPLVGGMAHGGRGPGSTRLMVDGMVHDRGAVGVTLAGARTDTLLGPGHRPFGAPMTVTAALGPVVTELAGVPAAERLAAAVAELPPEDRDLAARGVRLGIAIDEYVDDHGVDEVVVRPMVEVDDARGSIVMADPVRVGTTVRFCLADPYATSHDLADGLTGLRAGSGGGSLEGALFVACVERYQYADEVLAHDVRTLRRVLGAGGVAGMLSHGGIGPAAVGNVVHGLSAAVLSVASPSEVRAPQSRPAAGGVGA